MCRNFEESTGEPDFSKDVVAIPRAPQPFRRGTCDYCHTENVQTMQITEFPVTRYICSTCIAKILVYTSKSKATD
jgi:hypothetical protein